MPTTETEAVKTEAVTVEFAFSYKKPDKFHSCKAVLVWLIHFLNRKAKLQTKAAKAVREYLDDSTDDENTALANIMYDVCRQRQAINSKFEVPKNSQEVGIDCGDEAKATWLQRIAGLKSGIIAEALLGKNIGKPIVSFFKGLK